LSESAPKPSNPAKAQSESEEKEDKKDEKVESYVFGGGRGYVGFPVLEEDLGRRRVSSSFFPLS
jgi:hypothetical protein